MAWGINRELVYRLLPEKNDRETVAAQAKGSPDLIEFIKNVMIEEYFNNTFTNEYGEVRAYSDGYARHAEHVLNILKGLEDG